MNRRVILLVGSLVVLFAAWFFMMRNAPMHDAMGQSSGGSTIVAVKMPDLSGDAALGAHAFKGKCAACHGEDAGGVHGKGPPLIHKTYHPGHHGDFAFARAAREGARQHHWPFGDMPPVAGITDVDIKVIIAYVRAVQQANGIF